MPHLPPEILVGRETRPSYVDSTHESPYANRYDCMPANDYSGDNSSLKDILELMSKKLASLETKRYFPSPEFEQNLKNNFNRKSNAAALIVARAAESADNAFKSAISAAAACKTVLGENVKIAAMQRESTSMQNETWLHTVGRHD